MQTYSKLLKKGQKISKLKLGNKSVNLAYLGNINIKTAYLGSKLVFGDTEQHYKIDLDLRNIDNNLNKYREMRMYDDSTAVIPLYVRDRFEIVNNTVYLYTYGLGSNNYILDAMYWEYIDLYSDDSDFCKDTGFKISKNLYGDNYNCYYNKHGIYMYLNDQTPYDRETCYGGNAIGFTISCSKQAQFTGPNGNTTLTYQTLSMANQKIRLSYTASAEYSITKMSNLNQSFAKFSYGYDEYDVMEMRSTKETMPLGVSSTLLSYVLEVDFGREWSETDNANGNINIRENRFSIIWEIDNTTFTLPIYHVHTGYKPTGSVTTTPAPQRYITVFYNFKNYPSNFTEFYVFLFYNGLQINDSTTLLRCTTFNLNYGYGSSQRVHATQELYDEIYFGEGVATNVFTVTFKNSFGQILSGNISQNRMTSDGYLIEFTF